MKEECTCCQDEQEVFGTMQSDITFGDDTILFKMAWEPSMCRDCLWAILTYLTSGDGPEWITHPIRNT